MPKKTRLENFILFLLCIVTASFFLLSHFLQIFKMHSINYNCTPFEFECCAKVYWTKEHELILNSHPWNAHTYYNNSMSRSKMMCTFCIFIDAASFFSCLPKFQFRNDAFKNSERIMRRNSFFLWILELCVFSWTKNKNRIFAFVQWFISDKLSQWNRTIYDMILSYAVAIWNYVPFNVYICVCY